MPRSLAGLSINTATLGFQWALPRIVEACARLGIGGIAPWRRELTATPPAVAGRLIRDAGLAVTSLCRGGYLTHRDAAARAAVLDDNRRAIDDAALLGAGTLCFVVGGLPEGCRDLAVARAQVVDVLRALREYSLGSGVRLAVEPLHPMYAADRSCISTLATALDVCDAVGPELGLVIDAYHLWWDPELERGLARARPDRLLCWQVCDWLVPTRDLLMDRGMPGDGVLDLARLDRQVRAAGYAGLTEIEIFSDDWGKRDPAETLRVCAKRYAAIG
ncbi:MAG: sugar phosphate isomerase/epimerase family protein [Geminicoccaceae bacterium]